MRKRLISSVIVVICLALIASVAALGIRLAQSPHSSFMRVKAPISVSTNNNACNKVYLSSTDFYFTSYSENSPYGEGCTPYVRSLKTGRVRPLLSEEVAHVSNFCSWKNYLYFTCYGATQYDSEHGYRLMEYDMDKGSDRIVYSTPNTVQDISCCIVGDTLFYTCGRDKQDGSLDAYELRMKRLSDNSPERVVRGELAYPLLYHDDKGAICAYYDKRDDRRAFLVSEEGSARPISFNEDEYYDNTPEAVDGKAVYADFDAYKIIRKDSRPLRHNDCGYKYRTKYYLYDTASGKTTPLANASYWHYYA